MQKHLDTIIVGVLVFLLVVIILAIRPGYEPVEVSDDAIALMEGRINPDGEPVMAEEMNDAETEDMSEEESDEDAEGDQDTEAEETDEDSES
jgi:hypothetical protein